MDKACSNSLYTAANYGAGANTAFTSGTLLTNAKLGALPTYPSTITVPITPRGVNYTVKTFPIGGIVEQRVTNRYTVPSTGFKTAVSRLNESELSSIYGYFITSDIPGKTPTRKIILPTTGGPTESSLTSNLSGEVKNATESVSYDLLYSLQYEFCFYVKLFTILLSDLTKTQKVDVSASGALLTKDQKDDEIRKIVNNLSAVRARLNDIVDIAAYVGNKQTNELSGLSDQINAFVKNTSDTVAALNQTGSVLFNKDRESNLRSRQLEFSEEKNAYANQLLALYGFANLIALGLLFYIYKS